MTIYAELLLMLYNLTFFPASDRTTCDCTSIFRNTINPDLIISHHQEFCKKPPALESYSRDFPKCNREIISVPKVMLEVVS